MIHSEWYDNIIKDHPRLYSQLKYIECNSGWKDLIYQMSNLIEYQINNHIPDEIKDTIFATQVKQKFGSLRFYMSYYSPKIEGIINLAERLSTNTCEVCGNKGKKVNKDGWITVLCISHEKE